MHHHRHRLKGDIAFASCSALMLKARRHFWSRDPCFVMKRSLLRPHGIGGTTPPSPTTIRFIGRTTVTICSRSVAGPSRMSLHWMSLLLMLLSDLPTRRVPPPIRLKVWSSDMSRVGKPQISPAWLPRRSTLGIGS